MTQHGEKAAGMWQRAVGIAARSRQGLNSPFLVRTIRVFLLLVVVHLAGAVAAQEQGRALSRDEAAAYLAIGRVNLAGSRSCTGTLIEPRLVLTAAHCLFSPATGRQSAPGSIRFAAGLWQDQVAALRGVTRTAVLPGYLPQPQSGIPDLALLELDAPVTGIAPLSVIDWNGQGPVSLVAYGRDRAWRPSIRAGCGVSRIAPPLAVLDCEVVPGVSGAPVLRDGDSGPVVVAVVSARIGRPVDPGPAVVIMAGGLLAALEAELE